MLRKPKICILSEYAYSSLTSKSSKIGGSELQMSLLAKSLAKRSYEVSFVTFEKPKFSYELIDNIKVYNLFNLNYFDGKGHSYVFFYPQNIYKLMKILNRINADIYIKKGYSPLTGMIAFYSLLKNKKFIFVVSSEKNVSLNLNIIPFNNLKNIFYRYGVKNSTKVICQTNQQKILLKQKIGRNSRIIKNLCILSKNKSKKNNNSNLKIIWIGRLSKEKRVEYFLELAKNLPNYNFWMIAAIKETNYYKTIEERAKKIKNLDFVGFIEHNKINKYYKQSSLLINTSPFEGFPNTFLEAWGNSIPVISYGFDPDEIICNYELGIHVKNFDDLVKNVDMILKNYNLRKKMGEQGRKYVEKEHNINKIINDYEKLFKEIYLIKS